MPLAISLLVRLTRTDWRISISRDVKSNKLTIFSTSELINDRIMKLLVPVIYQNISDLRNAKSDTNIKTGKKSRLGLDIFYDSYRIDFSVPVNQGIGSHLNGK